MLPFLRAALCAAAVACAGQAHAATYLFEFDTSGVGRANTYDIDGQFQKSTLLNNVTISYTIRDTTPFYRNANGGIGAISGRSGIGVDVDGVGFYDLNTFGRYGNDLIAAKACFSNPSIPALPVLGIYNANSACSSATIDISDDRSYSASYTGTVTALRISLVDAVPSGGSFVNGVPEPSTWALMLAGFGLVGYAMRKRRPALIYA